MTIINQLWIRKNYSIIFLHLIIFSRIFILIYERKSYPTNNTDHTFYLKKKIAPILPQQSQAMITGKNFYPTLRNLAERCRSDRDIAGRRLTSGP